METDLKSKSPASKQGLNELHHKDTKIFFSHPIRQKIYEMFLAGGQYSVVDLSNTLKIPDPRSHIRFIRNSGVSISDYWMQSAFSKYKVYFIHLEGDEK